MEHSRENQLELVVSNSSTSLEECLHAQKDLFCSQIHELENIVLTQCKLTGVNPLSQEMAAGALSIKIGKRPRDLLNPKALKYMQSIFSIKDAISKKETREISALFGVTATQVRDFFTSQRSRVRKFVRLARDRANRFSFSKEMLEVHDGITQISDPNEPLDPVPLDSVAPIGTEDRPTCSKEDEVLPAIDESDKHFVESIFSLMRKEETFSGQVKLMEWILKIQNSSILYWFLTKGGIMILATWLSQAVVEEQTSVLHVILKVLCHLPLQKALPVHMSAVLQSVNRLRFYRASEISNRARILLSRWSKVFARSQALKKKNGTKSASDSQDEILLKQSISEVMGNGSWDCRIDTIEDVPMPLDESSGSVRKLESQPLKLLTASTDDTNKKLISSVRPSQNRERRKVLFVEQPCQKSAGRSSQVGRATAATQGRPLSADDIQKAKMRAQFMQNRYGKNNTSSCENSVLPLEAANKINSSQITSVLSASKVHSGHLIEEQKISEASPLATSNMQDASLHNLSSTAEEPPQKKCKRVQVPWQIPPEIILSVSWRVGAGENSKEVEVQKKRIHREREIIYKSIDEIPSDPREPWDHEIDYDDTLTPEIPIEQLPDAECAETSVCHTENVGTAISDTNLSFQNVGGRMPEPDMELLAVLLKNPELVFALTSGQANNLSNEETVKLLDMIKENSSSSSSLSVVGGNGKTEEKVEVSLPSPTPSSNPVTNGWKADLSKNPFSRQTQDSNEMQGIAGITAAVAVRSQHSIPASSMVPTAVLPTRSMLVAKHSTPVLQLAQQTPAAATQHQVLSISTPAIPSQQLGSVTQTGQQLSLHQSGLGRHETVASPLQPVGHAYASHMQQLAASELLLKTNTARRNTLSTPSMQVETARIVNPSALPNALGAPPRSLSSWANSPMHHSSYAPETQASHSWRPRQAMDQIPYHQSNMNLNNDNPLGRSSVRAPVQPGSWERNDLADEPDFESWSPENSPIRSHRYHNSHGWNYPQSRLNPGYSYPSSEIPKSHENQSPSGYRDLGKSGKKRWNDNGR